MQPVDGSEALIDALQSNLGPLRSMLIRRIGNEDDALDLLQDTYLRCVEAKTDSAIDNPRSYVWRLALNLAIDHQRSDARRQRLYSVDYASLAYAQATTGDPQTTTATSAYLKAFRRAIARLPPDCRRAYLMSRRDNLTYDLIARELGVPTNMVKKHIKRAIVVLRSHLPE